VACVGIWAVSVSHTIVNKGQFKALTIIQAPRRRWENRDVQQARPDPGL
jgi:hypothetical protein